MLSVWHVEDDESNLPRIVAALASGRQHVDKIDCALIDEPSLLALGIRVEAAAEACADEEASLRWHRNLIRLTASHLHDLVLLIPGDGPRRSPGQPLLAARCSPAIIPRSSTALASRDRRRPGQPSEEAMTNTELCYTPATELVRLIRTKALSPVELMRAVLERIERLNPTLNCFCTITADAAMAAAREAEQAVMRGALAGPAARHSRLHQGPGADQGRAHHGGVFHLRASRAGGGRALRRAAEGRRRHHDGQDHARRSSAGSAWATARSRAARGIRGTRP